MRGRSCRQKSALAWASLLVGMTKQLAAATGREATIDQSFISQGELSESRKLNTKNGAMMQQDSSTTSSQEDLLNQITASRKAKKYELSVAPSSIQLIDERGLRRVERIKEILEGELPDLETWHEHFNTNLEKLLDVTPFYNATEGYFEQEFRGEWSASSASAQVDTDKLIEEHELYKEGESGGNEQDLSWFERFIAGITTEAKEIYEGAKNFARNTMYFKKGGGKLVDPKLIHESFDEIYGWAQLYYKLQLYDVDFERLTKICAGEPTAVEESHFSDSERFIEQDDGTVKELVFVQDLLKKTEEFNSNTLLAELSISIRLYENDYIDYSAFIEFQSLFSGKLGPELSLEDAANGHIDLLQDLEVINAKYTEAISSRQCKLNAALTLTQNDASKSAEELKQAAEKLPSLIRPWAEQFSNDYNEENAYFLQGIGTDQDISDAQRLYFVDIAVGHAAQGAGDVSNECFPEQIKGLFLNKRKNEWISRFVGYGIIYLLASWLSIIMSVLQYREVKKNLQQGRAVAKNIAILPLLFLSSWTFQCLLFHLIMSTSMFFVDFLSQILPILALLGVFTSFYSITSLASKFTSVELKKSDLVVFILLLSFTMVVFSPRIMTKNIDTICMFGFLWVPQILLNCFTHPSWRFHYRFGFTLAQSLYYIFPPLYARGFHNNFYFLKPDPLPVRVLIVLYGIQLVIMSIQKHLCDWTLYLRCLHHSRLRYCVPGACRRALRRCLLSKVKAQHEWGWRLALQKIAEQKATITAQKALVQKAQNVPQSERNSNQAQAQQSLGRGPQSRGDQDRNTNPFGASDSSLQVGSNHDENVRPSMWSSRGQRSSAQLEIQPEFDVFGSPIENEREQYPDTISQFKYQFYLYFRSFRSGSLGTYKDGSKVGNARHNSLKDGVVSLSEECGSVDSPKAEEIDCSICTGCLKYRPNVSTHQRCSGYYETPCLHVYHRECLFEWLKVKLECPVCRKSLPQPLEYDGAAMSLFSDDEYEPADSQAENRQLKHPVDAAPRDQQEQSRPRVEMATYRNSIQIQGSVHMDFEESRQGMDAEDDDDNIPMPFDLAQPEPECESPGIYLASETGQLQRNDSDLMAPSQNNRMSVDFSEIQHFNSLMSERVVNNRPRANTLSQLNEDELPNSTDNS